MLSRYNDSVKDTQIRAALVQHMLGTERSSVLMTDAYKFSMAQAGEPLRSEIFYLSFRRPGWYYIPFDIAKLVPLLRPAQISDSEQFALQNSGLELNSQMKEALSGELIVEAAPKGSWVRENEPIVSIEGPSFLVSWLEALCIWMNFPIQIASEALLSGRREFVCSCEDEAEIVRLVLESIDLLFESNVVVDENSFFDAVKEKAIALQCSLEMSDTVECRIFEVGMRGATCMEMHRICLRAAKQADITMTSNVWLAHELGMSPVGSTGHEHQMRFDNDIAAFRAIRDRRKAAPSYLFDTYDAVSLGIPAAILVLRESPDKDASVRFDSGDMEKQLRQFVDSGVSPNYIFMDGMNPSQLISIEALCKQLEIPLERRWYGVGGYLGCQSLEHLLTRNRVSAVYKLSQSGSRPVMKFSTHGKQSLPGRLVVLRKTSGVGPVSVIAQHGEIYRDNYIPLKEWRIGPLGIRPEGTSPEPSPRTQIEMDALQRNHF